MGFRLKVLAMAAGLLAAPATAYGTEPALVISFDGSLDGQGRGRTVAATAEGKPVLAPGRSGLALQSGPSTGYVRFPAEGILDPQGGTVEMWVSPLDWRPEEEEHHVFFDARGEGVLHLYKFYKGTQILMLAGRDAAGPFRASRADVAGWKPREWHHVAGTWSADAVRVYVDGEPAGPSLAAGFLPRSFGGTFRIGDHPWKDARASSSLIDEVRIYDRPLAPEEIAAHFRGDFELSPPLRQDRATLTFDLDPVRWEAEIRLWTGGADAPDDRLEVWGAVVPEGGALPENASRIPFHAGQAVGRVPVRSREPGEYDIVAEIREGGRGAFEIRRSLAIPRLDERRSDAGLEDRVISPWTPLEVDGSTVRCWGRKYAFDRGPLPSRIRSAGEDLLAGPIRLVLRDGGEEARWDRYRAKVHRSGSDTRRVVSGSLRGWLGKRRIRVDVRSTVEYDGVVVIELSGDTLASVPLDAVALEIPLDAARAMYRHRWSTGGPALSGLLPAGEGVVDHDAFVPFYWLGDDARGLFWFAESDEAWPNGRAPEAVEVVRSGGRVLLRLNLLAAGQTLPRAFRFTFGLEATPVKPLPHDWRRWRLDPGRDANVSSVWPAPRGDSLKYYGYPEATDPAAFRSRVAGLHARGIAVVPYLSLTHLSAAAPEWPFFRALWETGAADAASEDVVAYGAPFERISPGAAGYAEFIVRKTIDFIAAEGADGAYHDNTLPFGLARVETGTGYTRGGKTYPTYPILDYRALYRRMATALEGLHRPTFTMAHMSGQMAIPIVGWDDAYLDGEQFRGRVKDSYMDVVSLDAFRAEFIGRQWGVAPFFLPGLTPPWSEQVEPTRGMMALLMLHDVSPWPVWCNVSVVNEALAALDAFGYADAEFVPYFDPEPPATTDMKDVYASAYRRSDGQVLLVVGNLSREDRRGEVRIDGRRLGARASSVLTWPDRREVPAEDGRVRLEIPRLGYVLLVLGPGR